VLHPVGDSRRGVLVNARTIFLFVLLFQSAVYAQSIRGTVTDPSHKPISNVTVQVTQEETGRHRTAVTNALGEFTVSNLSPGDYRIAAEVAGFRKHVRQVTLQLNQEASIEISLLAGQRTESVEVTA